MSPTLYLDQSPTARTTGPLTTSPTILHLASSIPRKRASMTHKKRNSTLTSPAVPRVVGTTLLDGSLALKTLRNTTTFPFDISTLTTSFLSTSTPFSMATRLPSPTFTNRLATAALVSSGVR